MIRALLLFFLLLLAAQPSMAIRQGTATADIFIKRYTQSGEYARLALWHETAAKCLKRISVPMNEIAHDYYIQHGYKKWAARAKKEAREIQKQYQYHRTRAEIARQQFVGGREAHTGFIPGECHTAFIPLIMIFCNPDCCGKPVGGICNSDCLCVFAAENKNIKKFITTWLPRYPDRFYEFGIYPTFFRRERELAEQERDYVKALHLEADAAEMCAAQYEQIPIAYGLRNYEKHRDAYRQYASRLRSLAQQNLNALPPEVDEGRQILGSLEIQTGSAQQKADAVIQIAKSDTRVKIALANQNGVHAHPSFQGFAWIVNFSNHSQGNIAVTIIDVKTMEVLDVF